MNADERREKHKPRTTTDRIYRTNKFALNDSINHHGLVLALKRDSLNLIDPVCFGLDLIGVHRRPSAAKSCIGFLT
jgi:hypothetical protein